MKLPSLLLISLAVLGTAAAQQVSDPQVMAEARSFRKDLAADIEAGRVLPEAALAKLKQRRSFFGAGLDTETDQTMAAEDIGQRLLTSAKPETAITFFRAAEGLLGVVIDRTTDAASKARLLINRARIRSQYLDRKVEAAADAEQAALLLPTDEYVLSWRDLLRRRDAQALLIQARH